MKKMANNFWLTKKGLSPSEILVPTVITFVGLRNLFKNTIFAKLLPQIIAVGALEAELSFLVSE